MNNLEERVKVLSMGGACLGYVSGHEASRRIREGRAKAFCLTRKQLKQIKMLHAGVAASVTDSMPQPLTYREEHGGHSIVVLKRFRLETIKVKGEVHHYPIWHKWDNTLSFAELRAGALKSAETLARQRDERALRNTA